MRRRHRMIYPKLDKNFYPMIKALEDFDKKVKAAPLEQRTKITLVVDRNGGFNYVYSYEAFKDGVEDDLNYRIAERLAKTILWVCGGYKSGVNGSE